MSEKIKPALTAEEWAQMAFEHEIVGEPWNQFGAHLDPGLTVQDVEAVNVPECERHALAALALHGQPFGFTRGDVRTAKWAAAFCEMEALTLAPGKRADLLNVTTTLNRLADRIEALLPPGK